VSDKGHVWGIEIACDPSLVQSCFDRMQRLIHVHGLQAERDAAREQLAASERTCAELRGDVNELRLDLAHMTDRHAVASERAEAAEQKLLESKRK
jgi:hypothetical protein